MDSLYFPGQGRLESDPGGLTEAAVCVLENDAVDLLPVKSSVILPLEGDLQDQGEPSTQNHNVTENNKVKELWMEEKLFSPCQHQNRTRPGPPPYDQCG